MSKNSKMIIIILIVFVIAVIISVILINKPSTSTNSSYIKQNNDNIIIDLSKSKKISVSYLSNNKDLTDTEKSQLLNNLQVLNFPIIKEQQLIVSTDYKIDFNNGIYFTFGQYGAEVDIYENNQKKFTTELSNDILNNIRKMFDNVENQNENQTNELHINQITVN